MYNITVMLQYITRGHYLRNSLPTGALVDDHAIKLRMWILLSWLLCRKKYRVFANLSEKLQLWTVVCKI